MIWTGIMLAVSAWLNLSNAVEGDRYGDPSPTSWILGIGSSVLAIGAFLMAAFGG